uniref:NADH-ubiquinone oxidoreductase chain 5 n=1 Tax=Monoserius pennarius TaxID=2203294 RepID=A0AA96HRB8_9CNID|nr:NADH dehydrogenase subunit 5 [Monoserius pennarius]WNO18772.1 NADH dehydrogenase subunit 5 [Monoserius pennarius]
MILIVILPFLNFFVCCLFGRKLGLRGVYFSSIIIMFLSLSFSLFCFWEIVIKFSFLSYNIWNWLNWVSFNVSLELHYDQTTCCMLLLINLISFCVHVFSLSYMKEDPHLNRFMGYLSLFTFFMNLLVTSGNLIILFIGWEGVGLCSYLLINFWYTRIQANKASIKAMVVNKIGDIGMLIGIILLWNLTNTFNFHSNFSLFFYYLQDNSIIDWVGVLFIIGVMAKSSQIGLHTWLPDAMEGPTPVSALIHAATMVTAGVYLIVRMSPLFENLPNVLVIIIILGSLTAFFAATIGVVQKDVKKIIAYSTCSQLGYMTLISGFSYYDLSLFHLFNHGIFKALLFLSAGSLIHSVCDEQDLRKLGSISYLTPITYISIIIGSFSLMGLPFLTGFYSKDLIIELICDRSLFFFFFWLSLIAAFLTSFYSLRLIHKSFLTYNQSFFYKFKKFNEHSDLIILILLLLSILSVIVGYFSEMMIISDISPAFISFNMKILPLVFSTIAAFLSIYLGYSLIKWWKFKFNFILKTIYFYLIDTWYFNQIYNEFMVKIWVNLGYKYNYKMVDNQFLERIGPKKFFNEYNKFSSKISNYNLGELSLYVFFIIVFFISLLIWF